jgi:hypothetical protein
MRPKLKISLAVLGAFALFSYGVVAAFLQSWPFGIYANALQGLTASDERREQVHKFMDNKAQLKNRSMEAIARQVTITRMKPNKMMPGLTLLCMGIDSAMLIDEKGKMLHNWYLPFSKVWPAPKHIESPSPDEMTMFFDAQLFPNGDLLALYHTVGDTPYGYGMVKIDKDSNLIWSYARNTHHDLNVAQDGTIYTLTQKYEYGFHNELKHFLQPVMAENVEILSADGKSLETIAIIDALLGTPWENLLYSHLIEKDRYNHDYSHANSVMKLEEGVAAAFPMFKAGDILVSLRNRNALVVIDPATKKVIWGMSGIWNGQHDAQFLSNGDILLFDNDGFADGGAPRSRVLEVDPATQEIAWYYTGDKNEKFFTVNRGGAQPLPNGNILAVESINGNKVSEVTREKETVWRLTFRPFADAPVVNPINKAYRIGYDALSKEFCREIGCRQVHR